MPSSSYEQELGFGNMGPAREKKLGSYFFVNQFDNGASAQAQAARMGSPSPIYSPDCLRGR